MESISPCLWLDSGAEEAASFYASLFPGSRIGATARYGDSAAEVSGQKSGSVLTVEVELAGLKIVCLNGGPLFKFTPALSFFVWCDTAAEAEKLWSALAQNGNVRMSLDTYPWAEKYGWTADRFGVEWQIMLAKSPHKIAPAFLFVDELFGKGEEALQFYRSIFRPFNIESIARDDKTQTILHCLFTLGDQAFVLMEGQGKHNHKFSSAFSLMVQCRDQSEIDHYWAKLTEGGHEEQCGWLKDRYGVSWQVVPSSLGKWVAESDPATTERVMKAVLGMHKLDMATLKKAHEDQ